MTNQRSTNSWITDVENSENEMKMLLTEQWQVWRTPKSRHSDSQMDGQTNGRYQTATDGLIGTEINHELKRQKTQMDK